MINTFNNKRQPLIEDYQDLFAAQNFATLVTEEVKQTFFVELLSGEIIRSPPNNMLCYLSQEVS